MNQLKRCIDSIRKYYSTNKIIIIDDHSLFNFSDIFAKDYNIFLKKSINKGGADMQTFKIFLDTSLFQTTLIMQDSMILENKLVEIDKINDIKFL